MVRQPPPPDEEQKAVEKAVEELPSQLVDLILFDNLPDKKWNFAGLIEFKRWQPEELEKDRKKLLELLKHLDTCPAGAVCCLTDAHCDDGWMQTLKREAESAGDRFFCHNVPELPPWRKKTRYAVYARAFPRGT
jgi:hypothetical protein